MKRLGVRTPKTGDSPSRAAGSAGPSEPINRLDAGQNDDSAGVVADMCPEADAVDCGRRGLGRSAAPKSVANLHSRLVRSPAARSRLGAASIQPNWPVSLVALEFSPLAEKLATD